MSPTVESGGPKPDQNVSVLVQIDGGDEQWERAARIFDALEWPHREPARDDTLPATESGSSLRWVEVPVAGSRRRAGHEAHWLLQEVSKREQLPLSGRIFRDPARRPGQRERMWQAYLGTRVSGPRAALHSFGALMGRFDTGERFCGDRAAALALARQAVPADQQARIRVRPSGWAGLVLLFVLSATACITVGPLIANTQSSWLSQDGLEVVVIAVYYSVGLVLFARLQRWAALSVTVLPLLVALLTVLLPGLGSLPADAFAEELGVAPADLPLPPGGHFETYLEVGRPLLASGLFFIAAWGFLRHFHLVRRGSMPALTAVILLAMVTMTWSVLNTVKVAGATAQAFNFATPTAFPPIPSGSKPYGLRPRWFCIEPTVPANELSTHGERLNPRHPYLTFNPDADRLTLFAPGRTGPLSVKGDQVRLVNFSPRREGDYRCPDRPSTDDR